MPEEKSNRSERKKSAELLYTQKQVDDMLERKERSLKVHYSLLIEVHQEYELLKKEHEKLKQKLCSMRIQMMAIARTGRG